jgi:hypothetical protein
MTFDDLRDHVADVLDDIAASGWLEEAFGYDCPDQGGAVAGTEGSNLKLFLKLKLDFDPLPFRSAVPTLDADQLFDLIEVIYPLISKPDAGTGTFHRWCGHTHNREFSAQPAQSELRAKLNPIMSRLATPLQLLEDGFIVELPSEALGALISEALPPGASERDVSEPVANAERRYLQARGDASDRKAAIVELAGVLEHLRPQLHTHMLNADENALFNIANNFAIRHRNRAQQKNYDEDTWLPWIFHMYLATVHAVAHAIARQAQVDASRS